MYLLFFLESIVEVQEVPIIQETPIILEIPAIQETPAIQEVIIIQELPAAQEVLTIQEIPTVQEISVVEEIPIAISKTENIEEQENGIATENKNNEKEEITDIVTKIDDDKKHKSKVIKTVDKSDRSLRSKNSTDASHTIEQEIKFEANTSKNDQPSQGESFDGVKRRGRRKLDKSTEDPSVEKPKRGRGRKPVNTNTEKHEIPEVPIDTPMTMPNEQITEIEIKVEVSPEPEKKIPRKRGRKPKVLEDADNSLKDKFKTSPLKKSPRLSKDGSESILASALARQKNDAAGMQTRLSRPIKPTAKILANEELRYGFEQQQNARLSLSNENLAMESEISPKKEKNIHEEIVPPEPKPVVKSHPKKPTVESVTVRKDNDNHHVSSTNSTTINNKESCHTTTSSTSSTSQTVEVSSKIVSDKTSLPFIPSHIPQKRPCPDPEQFLNEIKQSKIGLHRSPEDNKKLNRKQQKKLFKQKEKHLQMLGLTKASKLNSLSSDYSEDTSDDGNEEFLPTKKVNVGKPTLRLRNSHQPAPKQPVISYDKTTINSSRPGRKRKNLNLSSSSAKTVIEQPSVSQNSTSPKITPSATFSNKTVMVEIPCHLICMCRNKTRYFIQKTNERSFCTAVDEIDGKKVGCCNELSDSLINLVRPSVRVSYFMLCDVHRRRMRAHNCCAGCGVFCTQVNINNVYSIQFTLGFVHFITCK